MSYKRQTRIVISICLLLFSCKNKIDVNIPFSFQQDSISNIDFKIDTTNSKKIYNIFLSKSYFISMEKKTFGITKEDYEKPKIDYPLIKRAINIPKRDDINSKYNFYAIVKVNDSLFKRIPIKLSNITILD